MKTTNEILQMIRTATFFGIGMLLSTVLFAETTAPAQTFLQFLDNHPALRAKADLNNDGVIDKLEIKKAKRVLKWKKPVKPEKIHDYFESRPKLKAKADQNGDGQIDRVEYKKAKKHVTTKKIKKTRTYLENHPKAKVKADLNKDGKIGRVEAKKAHKVLKVKKKK